jgi:choline dehydrogenase-like flavoprotein
MIVDLAESQNVPPNAPNATVIVGGGPVGIYLAYCLSQAGEPVVVVEAGGHVSDTRRNETATHSVGFDFVGYRLGRAFGLGGTSVVWGGQLAEFDPADFAQWPLAYEDVASWYRKVYGHLSIYPEDVDAYRARLGAETADLLPVERFFTHWLPQQNFARLFRKQLIDDARVPILINGTVNGIAMDGRHGRSIRVHTADGRDLEIPGRQFVFCNGTLELARFFLSTARTGGVPWQDNGWIGKFYQDHPCGLAATADLIDETRFRNYFENAFTSGIVKLTSKLRFRPEVREPGDLGVSGFFSFRSDIQDQLANIKWLIRSLRSGAHSSNLAALPRDTLALLRMFGPIAFRFIRDRRVMAFFDRSIDFMVQCEQRPIERSQIRLRPDAHPVPGLFAIDIDWQIDAGEVVDTVNRFTLGADNYLRERGLARLSIDERVMTKDPAFLKTMYDVYHQAGGMCMSASPETGVVDSDCRVWGSSNVYVAGAAVFPSSSHANTTFTALAMAARLASTLQVRDRPALGGAAGDAAPTNVSRAPA